MATRQNLIDTYNSNPTLQSRYTLPQYLALFDFGQSTPTPASPPPTTGPTPGVPNIINQNVPQGGGRDNNFGGAGIGKFGNLDPSTKKTVYRDVYSSELGFAIPQPVEIAATEGGIFKELSTGKNVYHGGLDVQPVFASVMEGLGFGDKVNVDDETGFYEGEIMGTFNNPLYEGLGFFEKIKADNQRNKELRDLQKEIEANAAAATKRQQIGAQLQAASEAGGGYQPTTRAQNVARTSSRVGAGGNVKAYGLADGGRVYLYNRLK